MSPELCLWAECQFRGDLGPGRPDKGIINNLVHTSLKEKHYQLIIKERRIFSLVSVASSMVYVLRFSNLLKDFLL